MDHGWDFIGGVDVPGEVAEFSEDLDLIDCGRCGEPTRDLYAGLCVVCHDRLMTGGIRAGCGLALSLVTAFGGDFPDDTVILSHLIRCSDCRSFFSDLTELVRVAHIEAGMTRMPQAVIP